MHEQQILADVSVNVTPEIGAGFGGITAPEMSDDMAQGFAEQVSEFRRSISIGAPCVCIDGRCCNRQEAPFELGPHIAGGAMTLLVGAEAANHPFRGAKMLEYATSQGFDLRAHDDSKNRDAEYADGTGCGANDKLPLIGTLFRENKEAVGGFVQQLLGDEFDADIYGKVTLPEPSEQEWDKDFLRTAVGDNNVEHLVGTHGEQMVIFNLVPNTTIDRDAFIEATKSDEYPDGKQVFVVDVWYIKELARSLATGTQTIEQARVMEHAMLAYQIATYLALCDGSHRAAVLSPKQFATAA